MGAQESSGISRTPSNIYSGGIPTSRSSINIRNGSIDLSSASFTSRLPMVLAVEVSKIINLGAPPTSSLCRICSASGGRSHVIRLYLEARVESNTGPAQVRLLRKERVSVLGSPGGLGDSNFDQECETWRSPAVEGEVGCDVNLGGHEFGLRTEGPGHSFCEIGETALPELSLKVWCCESSGRDVLFGEARLPLDFTDLLGESREISLPVMRRNVPQTILRLRLGTRASRTALSTLSKSASFSLVEVARALAQVLSGEDGLQLLQDALHSLELTEGDHNAEFGSLQRLLRSLCTQAGMLSDAIPDADVLERMARFSHSIQCYVASLLPPQADGSQDDDEVERLSAQWIRETFRRVLQKSAAFSKSGEPSLPMLSEERLQIFLKGGRKFPRLLDVVPIDKNGEVVPDWTHWFSSPVPRSAYLSRGAQGSVYRAKNKKTGDIYALKDSPDQGHGDQPIDRRERELTDHILMAPHPCLVRLFGAFYQHRRSFIVMEFCKRGDLAGIIMDAHAGDGRYTPPPESNQWIGDIFLGLEHLHLRLQVLMRDVKPQNVVVTGEGRAKITDYGHSRIGLQANGCFTLHNAPPGTPEYVAPEVVLMRPYTFYSDLFSYGVLVWVLLTGGLDRNGAAPCARPTRNDPSGTYRFLAKNCQLLHKYIKEPSLIKSARLPDSGAAELILSLTQESSLNRPSHDALRSLKYIQKLNMPGNAASIQEVASWKAPILESKTEDQSPAGDSAAVPAG
mmetsp:Transcript_78108/g.162215  ORF Transcript_78108/g.162215 Transcript_78108/m.162215 type:complete len:739 (+) Transcript_78108:1-2217(+)